MAGEPLWWYLIPHSGSPYNDLNFFGDMSVACCWSVLKKWISCMQWVASIVHANASCGGFQRRTMASSTVACRRSTLGVWLVVLSCPIGAWETLDPLTTTLQRGGSLPCKWLFLLHCYGVHGVVQVGTECAVVQTIALVPVSTHYPVYGTVICFLL